MGLVYGDSGSKLSYKDFTSAGGGGKKNSDKKEK